MDFKTNSAAAPVAAPVTTAPVAGATAPGAQAPRGCSELGARLCRIYKDRTLETVQLVAFARDFSTSNGTTISLSEYIACFSRVYFTLYDDGSYLFHVLYRTGSTYFGGIGNNTAASIVPEAVLQSCNMAPEVYELRTLRSSLELEAGAARASFEGLTAPNLLLMLLGANKHFEAPTPPTPKRLKIFPSARAHISVAPAAPETATPWQRDFVAAVRAAAARALQLLDTQPDASFAHLKSARPRAYAAAYVRAVLAPTEDGLVAPLVFAAPRHFEPVPAFRDFAVAFDAERKEAVKAASVPAPAPAPAPMTAPAPAPVAAGAPRPTIMLKLSATRKRPAAALKSSAPAPVLAPVPAPAAKTAAKAPAPTPAKRQRVEAPAPVKPVAAPAEPVAEEEDDDDEEETVLDSGICARAEPTFVQEQVQSDYDRTFNELLGIESDPPLRPAPEEAPTPVPAQAPAPARAADIGVSGYGGGRTAGADIGSSGNGGGRTAGAGIGGGGNGGGRMLVAASSIGGVAREVAELRRAVSSLDVSMRNVRSGMTHVSDESRVALRNTASVLAKLDREEQRVVDAVKRATAIAEDELAKARADAARWRAAADTASKREEQRVDEAARRATAAADAELAVRAQLVDATTEIAVLKNALITERGRTTAPTLEATHAVAVLTMRQAEQLSAAHATADALRAEIVALRTQRQRFLDAIMCDAPAPAQGATEPIICAKPMPSREAVLQHAHAVAEAARDALCAGAAAQAQAQAQAVAQAQDDSEVERETPVEAMSDGSRCNLVGDAHGQPISGAQFFASATTSTSQRVFIGDAPASSANASASTFYRPCDEELNRIAQHATNEAFERTFATHDGRVHANDLEFAHTFQELFGASGHHLESVHSH